MDSIGKTLKFYSFAKSKWDSFWQKAGDFWQKNSRSKPEPMGWSARIGLSIAVMGFVGFISWGLIYLTDSARFIDPAGFNLAGEWEFYNGAATSPQYPSPKEKNLPNKSQLTKFGLPKEVKQPLAMAAAKELFPVSFPLKVKVPLPLSGQLSQELAEEFWYRKRVNLPAEIFASAEPLSVSLGSVKGPHTIWVNGEFFHRGGELGLANEILSEKIWRQLRADPAHSLEILVKVKKISNPYPGIVHATDMQVGRSRFLIKQADDYYFQKTVKPIIPAIFKAALFILFSALFIFMPKKREYIYFGLYCFFGALADFAICKFQPFYNDSYLRQKMVFWGNAGSAALVPIFIFEFLRLRQSKWQLVRWYGLWLAAIFAVAQIWIGNQEKLSQLFHLFDVITPYYIYLPLVIICTAVAVILNFQMKLPSRAMQVGIVSFCLFLAFLSNSALIKLSAFNSFYFYTFLSMGVLFGLAAALIIDFKSLDQSFGRSQLALPKVVRRLVAADVKKAVVEFSAITVLIDVVGYTKQLIQLNAKERDQYNSAIKSALQFLQAEFQGEKLSDTGDGAVYAWEYGNGEEFVVQLKNAIAACEKLIGEVSSQRQIQFRIGMAAGTVRCHFQAPDFSFLGDPINTAARLEAAAEVGQILLHESIYDAEYFYGEQAGVLGKIELGQEKSVEIKGASFRSRPYKNAA